MAYESPDLADLSFLTAKGFHATPTIRRGRFLFFSVDIDSDEAERLLHSAERKLIGNAFEALRRLRRTIDLDRDSEARR